MYSSCWPHFHLECFQAFYILILPLQDARSDWGPVIIFHLRWHLIRIRNAVWNEIKFMHPLNWSAFFYKPRLSDCKENKRPLGLYSAELPLHSFKLSQTPISVVLHSCFLKGTNGLCLSLLPQLSFFFFFFLKDTLSYLPTFQYLSFIQGATSS